MYRTYTGGAAPHSNCNTKYTSPLGKFDKFNSKTKTIATFHFSKIKSAYQKVARFLPKTDDAFTADVSGINWQGKVENILKGRRQRCSHFGSSHFISNHFGSLFPFNGYMKVFQLIDANCLIHANVPRAGIKG